MARSSLPAEFWSKNKIQLGENGLLVCQTLLKEHKTRKDLMQKVVTVVEKMEQNDDQKQLSSSPPTSPEIKTLLLSSEEIETSESLPPPLEFGTERKNISRTDLNTTSQNVVVHTLPDFSTMKMGELRSEIARLGLSFKSRKRNEMISFLNQNFSSQNKKKTETIDV